VVDKIPKPGGVSVCGGLLPEPEPVKNATKKNKKNFFRLFLGGKSFQLPPKGGVFQTFAAKKDLIFGKWEKFSY
jgi:hypothetical protein